VKFFQDAHHIGLGVTTVIVWFGTTPIVFTVPDLLCGLLLQRVENI